MSEEYRCKTCNHKYTKHFWAQESTQEQHDFMRPDGFCMKKDCTCESYKTTVQEKSSTVGVVIIAVLVMFGIGAAVSAMSTSSPNSDEKQCVIQSTRGPEPC